MMSLPTRMSSCLSPHLVCALLLNWQGSRSAKGDSIRYPPLALFLCFVGIVWKLTVSEKYVVNCETFSITGI